MLIETNACVFIPEFLPAILSDMKSMFLPREIINTCTWIQKLPVIKTWKVMSDSSSIDLTLFSKIGTAFPGPLCGLIRTNTLRLGGSTHRFKSAKKIISINQTCACTWH